ncbi:hypothetical protein JW898_00095 [Candidatus Woesearchaeota archaeon]|nr:hypothetical protein [Candidatus Woesearchaeota archaeon]
MAKLNEQQLQRMKRIQDIDDDDLELDITKRRRLRTKDAAERPAKEPEEQEESDSDSRQDTKKLLALLAGVFGIFLLVILLLIFYRPENHVMTVDELHEANLKGELKPNQGYIYHGFSFVNFAGVWHSRVQKGDTTYDITFNNDPKSVEDIPVEGQLSRRFTQGNNIYITFDTDATGTKYITVANAGLSMALIRGFGYNLTASCTNNESSICQKNGVVTCGDKDKAVIYFKEAAEPKIILSDNCVTVQGYGPDMVRAKDRLLIRWYGMMD